MYHMFLDISFYRYSLSYKWQDLVYEVYHKQYCYGQNLHMYLGHYWHLLGQHGLVHHQHQLKLNNHHIYRKVLVSLPDSSLIEKG